MIELKNISFSYGANTLFHDVNLTISSGDFVAITGANGCGKTTLLKIIMGQLKPTSGEIIYTSGCAPTIGYLPQYSAIDKMFPVSVREVVSFGLMCRRNMFCFGHNAPERLVVNDIIEKMSLGHIANKPIGKLSGGELQRVLLARAVVSSPQLLILDEPNTYLDNSSEVYLYEMLHGLNKNCAVLLVGHDLNNIHKNAKRIFVIDTLTKSISANCLLSV
ncbi:MAG: metal ABC transporter ATP-binding protein [Bacteroidaceae bacterium]|nr:metal ABC transporter ATP-binding protein [Bacteroidaceae bacterium]